MMKKAIAIKEQNKGRIVIAIREAEGRAKERLLDYDSMMRALAKVEDKLDIPKKYMKGVRVQINVNAQNFPRAYKYTPYATIFWAEHTGTGWKLINVYRSICGNKEVHVYEMPDDTKLAIINSKMSF